MAGDFDLGGFGDLANFSFFSEPTTGPSFGGGYDLGGALGGASTGFDPSTLPTLPDVPEAGGGLSDLAKGIAGGVKGVTGPIGEIAKPLLPIAQIGTAGMGIAAGVQGAKQAGAANKIQRDALQFQKARAADQMAAAQPLTQFGQNQLQQAQAGTIPPAEEARIQEWAAGAKQQATDHLTRAGLGKSSALAQWLAYIDRQAVAMRQQVIQGMQAQGIQSLTQGAGVIGQAGSQAGSVQEHAALQTGGIENLIEQSNKALAALSAGAA